ncbi:MAG: hypothetical protein PWR30_296 [Candidatus Woesearchaeota archaeon]|nr:hypothetical protein [Candidatus Woesearchaeota archaeon]
MTYGILPLNSIYNLIKKEGAERVSDKAARELKFILERKIKDVARISRLIALNAGRKTIMKKDVLLAIKEIGDDKDEL